MASLFVPLGGKLADKFGHKPILVIYFLIASVLLYSLSFKWDIAVLSILVFIIGGMINANQSLLYAYVGVNYPLNFRSTATWRNCWIWAAWRSFWTSSWEFS